MTTKTTLTALTIAAAALTMTTLLTGGTASASGLGRGFSTPSHTSAHGTFYVRGIQANQGGFRVRVAAPHAPAAGFKGAQPRPTAVRVAPSLRRAHPADDEECAFEVDGHKYLCTGGAGVALSIVGALAL